MNDLGKLPPQAIDMEEALLGAYMLSTESILNTIDLIRPKHFYKDQNRIVCEAAFTLYKKNEPVDMLTVVELLRNSSSLEKAGGIMHIAKLTDKIDAPSNAEYYARIVSEKYIKREYIRISSELQSKAYDDSEDMQDVITFAEKSILTVSEQLSISEPQFIEQTLPQTFELIKKAQERAQNGEFTGIPTGLRRLDEITGGWQDTDLIILAARPAMGKTAVAMYFAKAATTYGFPSMFFSCEMSVDQLNSRLISGETEYTPSELRTGSFMHLEQIEVAVGILSQNKVMVDDTANINIHELCAKARRAKKKSDIKLIIVDYIQLVTAGKEFSGNREQEVSYISRTLKALAKDLRVPVIALAQLNRSLENRPNKKPQNSDLRESGAIEQDADMIMFVHRPIVYGEEFMMVHNGVEEVEVSSEGLGMIPITKNRHGMLDDVMFKHNTGMTDLNNFSFDNGVSDFNPSDSTEF